MSPISKKTGAVMIVAGAIGFPAAIVASVAWPLLLAVLTMGLGYEPSGQLDAPALLIWLGHIVVYGGVTLSLLFSPALVFFGTAVFLFAVQREREGRHREPSASAEHARLRNRGVGHGNSGGKQTGP